MNETAKNKYIIDTGIGLQGVDNLKNSSYFINETNKYIKGEISLDELDCIISSYYESKPICENREEEADKVAVRIAKIISEDSFTFTVGQLLSIHRMLFSDILNHPGEIRTYNFTKKEWALDGDSVTYGDYRDLEMTLQYDFEQEKKFNYKGLSLNEIIEHLAIFVANLWQIHVFEEGNTRTTAVFFIKYLRSLGFNITNDVFAKNAWYFRNSLVRANYNNITKSVYEDRSYLIKFLRNLLLEEHNDLQNRNLHISTVMTQEQPISKESKTLNIIKSNSKITTDELAKELGVSLRTIKNIMKSLVDKKKIERMNGKRFGYWKIR
ncbi:MAG: Fic family protein [Bacilli bacterium]